MQDPDLSSRHLHAGHRAGSQQAPPTLIPRHGLGLGFDAIQKLSTRHQWFTHVRLLRPHLTRSRRAVSATLTPSALNRRSLRWFAASPCRAAAEGHTSISGTAPKRQSVSYIGPPFRSRQTRCCHSTIVSNTRSVIRLMVSRDTSAPYTSARWACTSPVVRPLATSDTTKSSTPTRRRWRLRTILGSKVPLRSRGTSTSTGPMSVTTVLVRVPLRELPEW